MHAEKFFYILLSISLLLELYHFTLVQKHIPSHSTIETEFNIPSDEHFTDTRADFSACLLIKDENNNLPEWIAYHYHVVKLRNLVVCKDPTSVSSPAEILSRWNGTDKMGMNIFLWDDDKYMPKYLQGRPPLSTTPDILRQVHKARQKNCYVKCSNFLKSHKLTWTMFIDADEFLTYNTITDDEESYQKLNSSDVDSLFVLKDNDSIDTISKQRMIARTRFPKKITQKTVGEFILDESNNMPWNSSGCIVVPRLLFGNKEEENLSLLGQGIPSGFDVRNFTTVRFFRHAKKGSFDNRAGKTVADISRIHNLSQDSYRNCHSLWFPDCGGRYSAFPPYETSLLRVNHYTRSKEDFFAKTDHRRKSSDFLERSKHDFGTSFEMQPWLISFVHSVGQEKANKLLKGAGVIGNWKHDLYDFQKNELLTT